MRTFKSIAVRLYRGIAAGLVVFWCVSTASAAIVTTPVGLNPGDQYRLAFVTSTIRDATSTDISVYNTFVTNAANTQAALVALGTTWRVIGSTATVDARDNTNTNPFVAAGVPIYLLDGVTKIADNNADLWDGTLDAGLSIKEDGTSFGTGVWTGTHFSGIANPSGTVLGSITGLANTGLPLATNSLWVDGGVTSPTNQLPFYALSDVLTVGAAVPEPATLALFALGLVGLGAVRRRRRT